MTPERTGNTQATAAPRRAHGSSAASASSAHSTANMFGSRWVAARCTAGAKRNARAATDAPSRPAETANAAVCSPVTRRRTKTDTRW